MRIIDKASVYLLGSQVLHAAELSRYMRDIGTTWVSDSEVAAEAIVETGSRTCYQSFAAPRPGGNFAHLAHIKETGHGSVLEHAVWTFVVTGVSRSLTHEFVRHRAGMSPSQLSQRYVDESVAEFVVPPDLAPEVVAAQVRFQTAFGKPEYTAAECNALFMGDGLSHMEGNQHERLTDQERAGVYWIHANAVAHETYKHLAGYLTGKAERQNWPEAKTDRRKFARQAARSVLGNDTETKLTFTANARALRHIIEQRGSRFADPEIRRLAGAILDILAVASPNIFGDYRRLPLPDDTFELVTDHRKI